MCYDLPFYLPLRQESFFGLTVILKHNRLVFLCRSNFIPEALKGYSKHPEHVAVADSKVRPFTASRACLDFEI